MALAGAERLALGPRHSEACGHERHAEAKAP